MLQIKNYFEKIKTTPPDLLFKKIKKKLNMKISNTLQRKRDLNRETYIDFNVPIIKNSYINVEKLRKNNLDKKIITYLSDMYLSHRFDLLGTGWVKNSYESESLGLDSYRYNMNVNFKFDEILLPFYREKFDEIFSLIDEDYKPIDWQKDYKTGFRWSSKKWYKEQRSGQKKGSDIKIPWELSRMQHLPQLALFSLNDRKVSKKYIGEFKNQVLDFIATNPPRMGCNWSCAMDVSIRASNMLLAYDIFLQIDNENILDRKFRKIFANSIYEHGLHLVSNLEYNYELTSNHYLSDVAGLLFISAYLECSEEIELWLAFSIQEVVGEFFKQFNNDGTNFEASTSYHRLSLELIIYSTAVILGLKGEKIDGLNKYNGYKWKREPELRELKFQDYFIKNRRVEFSQNYIDRLYRSCKFTINMTKPTGEIAQIGDNDSGRFFRLTPVGSFITNIEAEKLYLNLKGYNENIKKYSNKDELFWDENILNHSGLISAFSGIFNEIEIKNDLIENKIISLLSNGRKLEEKDVEEEGVKIEEIEIGELKYSDNIIIESAKFGDFSLTDNLRRFFYPDSGFYIFKSDKVYLFISAGGIGQNGRGGHAHNDKLSFELNIDGKDIVKDPGSYLYTPIPKIRNKFRSIRAHNTLIVEDEEQNELNGDSTSGLFRMKSKSKCHILNYGEKNIEILLKYGEIIAIRRIEIEKNRIIISDSCNKKFRYEKFEYYSNGYGKLIHNNGRLWSISNKYNI